MNSSARSASALDDSAPASVSRGRLWTGRVLSTLIVLFLGLDAVMKFVQPPEVLKGTIELGYPASTLFPMGVVLLVSVLLYAVPRTAVLGAILLTGYLGGAVATHLRVGNPLASHTLFPVYFGVVLWAGLALRDHTLARVLLGRRGRG